MTALTLYPTSANSSSLIHSELMVAVGGASGGTPGLETINSSTGWGEIGLGAAPAWAGGGAIGAPSGQGAFYDGGLSTLTNQQISAGNWSATINLSIGQASKSVVGTLILRLYKYNTSTTTYTAIGSITLSGQTITSVVTAYNFAATSMPAMSFGSNESVYCDLWMNISSNNQTSGGSLGYSFSNSSTLGWTGAQIVTPGYTSPTNLIATMSETTAVIDTLATQHSFSRSETTATSDKQQTLINIALTETTTSTDQVAVMPITFAIPGTPGGVRLLINDVWYPTIRQETINIDRTANDPISTFKFTLQDDPSQIPLSELQEVVFLDAGQIANPTHNLLRNPVLSPFATNWSQTTVTGGTLTQVSPGVRLTAANVASTFGLSQLTQNGLIVAGQWYMLSCFIQSTTLTNLAPFLSMAFLTANGTVITTQSLPIPPSTANIQYSLSGQAPNGAVTAQISLGLAPTTGTNSGSSTFSTIQFEPMSFAMGDVQQFYPSAFCANGQANCTLMPDGTTIRQYRLFGGYVTKATAGRYIGNNRQWTVSVSGYAWLIQKQLLNDNFTNQTDKTIIINLATKYFPNQFSTAQVVVGATLDVFGYTYNGTMRDALDALASNANYYYYIDAYRTIYFQAPGYNQLGFTLSDQPDNASSFPYDSYSLDLDGTQLGNACLVTGGTNISAIEYDAQSIGYYNQKTNGQGIFWRTVNDSTIASTASARQRAIAEITQYNYARQIAHLTTNQMMIPGYTVRLSSRTDQLNQVPFLVQKSTLTLLGFQSLQVPTYQCQCDLGAFNPDLVNITIKLLRKQLTNTGTIGTPVIGLMATEEMTFLDSVRITPVTAMPSNYGVGTYGTSTYAFAIPSIPTTTWGSGVWGDASKGYN